MSSSTPEALCAIVLTISDSCARHEREDLSGPAVAKFLREHSFTIAGSAILPDECVQIQQALVHWTKIDGAKQPRLILTTGGTGIAPRDVTPEATRSVCDRILEGVAERMRAEGAKKTPFAVLSRGICGVRGTSLILNLPGSPKGAIESLETVIDLLPHALHLLSGNTEHPQQSR
jgi:molybdopterin adenylyltransferase